MKKKNGVFVALAGVTGVGKTTTIEALEKLDARYKSVIVDTTRQLRPGETKKRHVDESRFIQNKEDGKYWGTNFTHGNFYGSPRGQVYDAINSGLLLLSDYDIDNADVLKENFPEAYLVYLIPPSIEEIKRRLANDKRENIEQRMKKAVSELERFKQGEYNKYIDLKILSETGRQRDIAQKIHASIQALMNKNREL